MAQTTPDQLRAAIVAANGHFMAAFRRSDAAGIAALYTESGQLLPPNSDVVTGKPTITTFWQGVINLGLKGATLETVEVESSGDTAFEVGRYTLEGDGGQVIDTGKYVVIWKQEAGQWKLHRDIWNSSQPAPGS
jgi:ketosteroid isomerase-like protein